MTAVPHSGNRCSGLCITPCEHIDCWQCAESAEGIKRRGKPVERALQELARKRVTPTVQAEDIDPTVSAANRARAASRRIKELQRDVEARDKARQTAKGILSQVSAESPVVPTGYAQTRTYQVASAQFENGTIEITRRALEELCDRAGVSLTWDEDGQPVIERNEGMWGDMQAAANRIGRAAAETMDKHVAEILKGQNTASEDEARRVLKAQGASDEDIDAAVEILKWEPENEEKVDPFSLQYQEIDITPIVAQWVPPSGSAIDELVGDEAQRIAHNFTREYVEAWKKAIESPLPTTLFQRIENS